VLIAGILSALACLMLRSVDATELVSVEVHHLPRKELKESLGCPPACPGGGSPIPSDFDSRSEVKLRRGEPDGILRMLPYCLLGWW
jgi:hypothetical protein